MDIFKVTCNGFKNDYLQKKNQMSANTFIDDLQIRNNSFLDMLISSTQSYPRIVADGISINSAKYIFQRLDTLGCIIQIDESNLSNYSQQEKIIQSRALKSSAPVLCPRCGSNQIATGQRGFNIVTGFIGSNQTVNRCAKCGFSWKP